jgi:hypothetical protein
MQGADARRCGCGGHDAPGRGFDEDTRRRPPSPRCSMRHQDAAALLGAVVVAMAVASIEEEKRRRPPRRAEEAAYGGRRRPQRRGEEVAAPQGPPCGPHVISTPSWQCRHAGSTDVGTQKLFFSIAVVVTVLASGSTSVPSYLLYLSLNISIC